MYRTKAIAMMQDRDFRTVNQSINRLCMHGASCVKYGCPYKHPSARPRDCPNGTQCRDDNCQLHHPRSNKEIACRFGTHCGKPICPFAHDAVKTPTRFCKPCMHLAFCVKFGCGYAHPPGRRQECEFGVLCKNSSCPKLHPRPSKSKQTDTPSFCTPRTPKFQVGQLVQAQYTVGTAWRLANVCCVNTSSLTLQFWGYNDTTDVPLERIRQKSDHKPVTTPLGFGSVISRGAAVWSSSPRSSPRSPTRSSPQSPRSPPPARLALRLSEVRKYQSDNLKRLEQLKQDAITKEDFLLADKLKQHMNKLNELESKKSVAVQKEDFLLAMDIKKQIDQILTDVPSSISISGEKETKQECDDRFYIRSVNHFSLFDKPLERIRVC